uniref:Upf2 domain-containing protein n=1 Tax=Globodera pallida TaxID=36090 RepID=A0A183BNY7_GLOPA
MIGVFLPQSADGEKPKSSHQYEAVKSANKKLLEEQQQKRAQQRKGQEHEHHQSHRIRLNLTAEKGKLLEEPMEKEETIGSVRQLLDVHGQKRPFELQ